MHHVINLFQIVECILHVLLNILALIKHLVFLVPKVLLLFHRLRFLRFLAGKASPCNKSLLFIRLFIFKLIDALADVVGLVDLVVDKLGRLLFQQSIALFLLVVVGHGDYL